MWCEQFILCWYAAYKSNRGVKDALRVTCLCNLNYQYRSDVIDDISRSNVSLHPFNATFELNWTQLMCFLPPFTAEPSSPRASPLLLCFDSVHDDFY